ncbi:phosphatase PAP2 family protein [Pseudoalteromonas sp. G4]|uniref:phosphatase PAP2 family protein n=1 Tax=Pseudoalteromonas sp. G4 TaxID=2992761 RepID=UPI00237EDF9C|nr:phosphatase PAP2 family protein [Pseudoalteromonas sp. G4]MDE3273911.1 phosphatase PAP2 family protein [Pseudoalteromonas sp. G4]
MQTISQLDRKAFFKLFNHQASKRRLYVIKTVSKLGDGFVYLMVGAVCYVVDTEASKLALSALILGFALERPIYYLLKNTLKRERPSQTIVEGFVVPSDRFSLPSGHSSAAWLFASVISWYFPELSYVLFVAVAISLSRVMLGVHYPCDILVGAMLGICFASVGIIGATL